MANDPTSGPGVPEEVSAWLDDFADEQGLTTQELLERLVAGEGADATGGAEAGVADLDGRVEELEAAVADLDDRLDDQVRDVRERVIQVKREADAKAPIEHDHPEVVERLRQVAEHLEALGNDFVDLDADVDRLDERIDDVDDRTTRGFSNYEDVLEYLVDTTDDLRRKVDAVASVVMELRERTTRLNDADATREELDRLREAAHVHGVTRAKCEDCGETVHLGLLGSPSCPHCEASFARLDPSRGFFRSSVLRTGRPPALEGEVDGPDTDLSGVVETDVGSPPEFGRNSPTSPAAGEDGAAVPTGGAPGSTGEAESDPATAGPDPVGPGARGSGAGGSADLDVVEVDGIGSAYAERLQEAGVETVGQLAFADPGELADATDVPPGRVETWVERAREMVESG